MDGDDSSRYRWIVRTERLWIAAARCVVMPWRFMSCRVLRFISCGSPGDKFVAMSLRGSRLILFFATLNPLNYPVFRMNAQLDELSLKEKLQNLTDKQRESIYLQILDLRSGSKENLSQPLSSCGAPGATP